MSVKDLFEPENGENLDEEGEEPQVSKEMSISKREMRRRLEKEKYGRTKANESNTYSNYGNQSTTPYPNIQNITYDYNHKSYDINKNSYTTNNTSNGNTVFKNSSINTNPTSNSNQYSIDSHPYLKSTSTPINFPNITNSISYPNDYDFNKKTFIPQPYSNENYISGIEQKNNLQKSGSYNPNQIQSINSKSYSSDNDNNKNISSPSYNFNDKSNSSSQQNYGGQIALNSNPYSMPPTNSNSYSNDYDTFRKMEDLNINNNNLNEKNFSNIPSYIIGQNNYNIFSTSQHNFQEQNNNLNNNVKPQTNSYQNEFSKENNLGNTEKKVELSRFQQELSGKEEKIKKISLQDFNMTKTLGKGKIFINKNFMKKNY